jgi:hypothetical protein
MPPSKDKKRYEVHFDKDEQKRIEALAKRERRSIKNWMETIIRMHLIKSLGKSK